MTEPTHKYLRVTDLRALRGLAFTSRRAVEGRFAGRHASPYRGQSVEFSDYRPYSPGDEPRDIDWKAYGRSDRLFVKLFEHQTDLSVCMLIDGSASMAFRGVAPNGEPHPLPLPKGEGIHSPSPFDSKYDHACRIAAGIAYLMTRQRDRVSLAIAQDGLARFVAPGATHGNLVSILETMERFHPAGEASLPLAIESLALRVRRRMLLLVFSDLIASPQSLTRSLSRFLHGGARVVVFHVLHRDELNLPSLGELEFEDSESGHRLQVSAASVAGEYANRAARFLDDWSARCRGLRVDHRLSLTHLPYTQAISGFLRVPVRAS